MRTLGRLSVLVLAVGCGAGNQHTSQEARVEAYPHDTAAISRWDTFLEVRSEVSDTTLLLPFLVEGWRQGAVVADAVANRLTFVGDDGTVRWTIGRSGQGPLEFQGINDLFVGPDSMLWVLDASNLRIAKISPTGQIVDTQPMQSVPPYPWGLLYLGDSLLVLANHPERAVMRLEMPDLGAGHPRALPWPGGIPEGGQSSTRGAVRSGTTTWAAGLQLGPGFFIGAGNELTAHEYVEPVPFATAGPTARAVFGATAAHGTAESLYFLFGGRPKRIADMEGDPPRRIDEYSWEGVFRQRYLLPGEVLDFHTDDGVRFYIVQAEPVPALLGLRARQ